MRHSGEERKSTAEERDDGLIASQAAQDGGGPAHFITERNGALSGSAPTRTSLERPQGGCEFHAS